MKRLLILLLLVLATVAQTAAHAADTRQLVNMPPMMRDHMLATMRGHLQSLNDIFQALSAGENSQAAKIAEQNLGLSSMEAHGASHMAPYMPQAMQAYGTAMHRAASRFARAIETADIEPTAKSQQAIYAALGDITVNCAGCHQAFRLR